jgi:hypothetical protein
MNKYIIIISKEEDIHTKVVRHFIEKNSNIKVLTFDTSEFPYHWKISNHIDQGNFSYKLRYLDKIISSEEIGAVWYRRFYYPVIREVDSQKIRSFCSEESSRTIDGWMESLGDKMFNSFNNQNSVDNKLFQLKVANEFGLKIPNTLISNDKEEVKDFIKKIGKPIIFKSFTGSDFQFVETRKFKPEYL